MRDVHGCSFFEFEVTNVAGIRKRTINKNSPIRKMKSEFDSKRQTKFFMIEGSSSFYPIANTSINFAEWENIQPLPEFLKSTLPRGIYF